MSNSFANLQAYDERLQCFAKAGFTLATGIPFDVYGYQGIVIFFGNPHIAETKLHDERNSKFIKHTAQFIGTAAALQAPLQEIKRYKKRIYEDNWHVLKVKMLSVVRFGGVIREQKRGQNSSSQKPGPGNNVKWALMRAREWAKVQAVLWWKKSHGGNAAIPPPFSNTQSVWTFVGVLVTHIMFSGMNVAITKKTQGELDLVLPPLGALTTLQFALTAAPASQPRNAIFSQIFALTTALFISYIPNMEPWLRDSLAPAIVIKHKDIGLYLNCPVMVGRFKQKRNKPSYYLMT
mmetsp:Transcript_8591/g.17611  ORF Transcript_8591/g.17611 Transcript_8591/m.17611 type:complete len:292 (+) Transcript_8591:1113-1988(+)